MIRTVLRPLALLLALLLPTATLAQANSAFVQIEAHPTLAEAQERARAYGALLPDLSGFALGNGWYGLALGPYERSRARGTLRRLRLEGLVPRDSYVTAGGSYRQRFWPPADGVTPAPEPEVGTPAPRSEIETSTLRDPLLDVAREALARAARERSETGEAPSEEDAPGIADAAPEPPAPLLETPRQARRSEARLDRDAKMELQRALAWFDHYAAAIDGSFGRGTRNAMAAWQRETGRDVTGILTTAQRADLLDDWRAAQAALGLAQVEVAEAGIALTAPMALVERDRIEAPFVHYRSADDSGVRLSLISQAGEAAALAGLYALLQTLDIVPERGPRSLSDDAFDITGIAQGRTTRIHARVDDGHVLGYLMSWPAAQDALAVRALPVMERSLVSVGAPLAPEAGFDADEQSVDMVSGLEVRRPLASASGFYVGEDGLTATAARFVEGCARITLDRRHAARVESLRDGVALLRPEARLAPATVATLAPSPGRLGSAVAVSGYPYGGILGAATLAFGTLEDVRAPDGASDVLRLSVQAGEGEVGGPVLDARGHVAGVLLPGPEDRVLPAEVAFAARARAVAEMLSDLGATPEPVSATPRAAGPLAPEALTRRAAEMTVLVSCWE